MNRLLLASSALIVLVVVGSLGFVLQQRMYLSSSAGPVVQRMAPVNRVAVPQPAELEPAPPLPASSCPPTAYVPSVTTAPNGWQTVSQPATQLPVYFPPTLPPAHPQLPTPFGGAVNIASKSAPQMPQPPQRVRFHGGQVVGVGPSAEAMDLADGMSYMIKISRHEEHQSSPQIRRIERVQNYGGKSMILSDVAASFVPQSTDLRVFANDVSLNNVDDAFQLTCEGKVIVVAPQSMIRGEGLELNDGVFKILKAEVVTADAEITTGDAEFEFEVGGIAVVRIAGFLEELAEQASEDGSEVPVSDTGFDVRPGETLAPPVPPSLPPMPPSLPPDAVPGVPRLSPERAKPKPPISTLPELPAALPSFPETEHPSLEPTPDLPE